MTRMETEEREREIWEKYEIGTLPEIISRVDFDNHRGFHWRRQLYGVFNRIGRISDRTRSGYLDFRHTRV